MKKAKKRLKTLILTLPRKRRSLRFKKGKRRESLQSQPYLLSYLKMGT